MKIEKTIKLVDRTDRYMRTKTRTLTYDWMSPFAEKIVMQLVDMARANENHAVDPYL